MKLSKYPVVSGNGFEYKVDVVEEYVSAGLYQFVVKIYVEVPTKFNLFKKYKFKQVYKYSTGWGNYKKYVGKYVELTKKAVSFYEEQIYQKQQEEIANKLGIEKFNTWDGKC